MEMRRFGNTGIKVSAWSLGTMTFGGNGGIWDHIGGMDEGEASAVLSLALDSGINLIDTADFYGDGRSEELLGKLLQGARHKVILVSKAGFPSGAGANDRGLSRRHLASAVDASLSRLKTDHLDVFFLHLKDCSVPLEESLLAADLLVRSGKIRYYGLSNFPAWEVMRALLICKEQGFVRPSCIQVYYNLLARDIEREILPAAVAQGLGVMAWSPLAGGLLTGKYGDGEVLPAGSRRAGFDPAPFDQSRLAAVNPLLKELARQHGVEPLHIGLAWLRQREGLSTTILGVKTASQLQQALAGAELALSKEEMARLDAASELPTEYPAWYIKDFSLNLT